MATSEREPAMPSGGSDEGERFEWHPEYRGRTVAEVRQGIRSDLAHDQRAYTLAMEGAEHQEHASLSAVIDLEKKWGGYNLDWAEADPEALADQIVAFERERDRRRELFAYRDYRQGRTASPPPRAVAGMTTGTSSPGVRWGAALAVLIVVVILLIVLI